MRPLLLAAFLASTAAAQARPFKVLISVDVEGGRDIIAVSRFIEF